MGIRVFCALLALLTSCDLATRAFADVIYRETFGNASSPVARQNPNVFGWQVFNQSGAALATVGGNYAVDTTAGFPADLVNVNSGTNSDGGTGAVGPGPYFWAANQAGRLSFTPEYSVNLADYSILTFSWYQGNANTVDPLRLAVHIGGAWYVNKSEKLNTVSGISGSTFGSAAGPNAQLVSTAFDPAAANWEVLSFNGTYNGGGTFGGPAASVTASSSAMSLSANSTDLTGTIDGFGYLFWASNTPLGSASANAGGNVRIDNYQIDAIPVPEPVGWSLMAAAIGMVAAVRRRRR